VAEIVLDGPGILAIVCQLVAARMPQHVAVHEEREADRPWVSFLPSERSTIFFPAVSLSRSSDKGQSEFGYRLDEKFS
jgi:hypothetical protein